MIEREGGGWDFFFFFFFFFAYILFMDLLGRWGMQLRRLQTLPYLTNQPFDVPRSEAGCGKACQMKIGSVFGDGVGVEEGSGGFCSCA